MRKVHMQEKSRDQASQIEIWDACKVVLAGRRQRMGKNNTLVSELPGGPEFHFLSPGHSLQLFFFRSLCSDTPINPPDRKTLYSRHSQTLDASFGHVFNS